MSNEVYDFNIGHSTAYAYAKASGDLPEGMTPEEYGELLASYATVGQTAVDAKDAAVAAKTAAQTAATTATNKATEATTAATTATTKAGEASTSASTATSAKDTAVSASQTATTKATEATTAAATAVSAKDDAVAANTAAQSAKTAAQTAQTGAETAAASVSASAAQIATNAEDISQLKSDLNDYTKESYNIYSDTDDTEHWYIQDSGKLVANDHHTTIIIEKNVNSGDIIVVNTFGKLPTVGTFKIGISTTKPQADDTVTRLTSGISVAGKYAIAPAVSGNYIIITYGASTLSADDLSDWDEIVKENLLVAVTTNQSATLDDFPYLPKRIIDVQEVNLSEDLKNKINSTPSATGVRLITSVRIPVESNVASATNTTAGTGWSGDFSNGYTHTSGNTDPITIDVDASENDEYVVEFDYNGNYDGFGFTVSLGDSYACDVYNGTNHVVVGLKAVNAGDVVLTPFSAYTGTVSNIKCRKVVESSQDYVEIDVNSISYTESATELTAFWNVRLGLEALNENINGSRNIAIGTSSLKKLLSGTRNIGIGTFTFPQLKGGEENIGIGADAGLYTQEATSSIAIGKAALSETKKTTHDIAIGRNALYGSRTGTTADNIAIGRNSAYKCASSNNIYIGAQAGYNNVSGYNNVVVGPNADVQNNGNGSIAIGNNVKATKSKQCMIGSTAITEVVFCGNKKINFNSDGTVTWEELT